VTGFGWGSGHPWQRCPPSVREREPKANDPDQEGDRANAAFSWTWAAGVVTTRGPARNRTPEAEGSNPLPSTSLLM